MDYSQHFPLLLRKRWPIRGMADDIADVDVQEICREYRDLRNLAPKRKPKRRYFVGHNGVPSTSGGSNRREEHVAIAVVNLGHTWLLDGLGEFSFLDYQVPLKSKQTDKGIGKVDLLGRTSDGRLLVVELKVIGQSGGRSDPPITAFLEGLRYAAILEANLAALDTELRSSEASSLSVDEKPVVLVLGERSWWQSWQNSRDAPRAMAAFFKLTSQIAVRLGLSIHCAEVSDMSLTYGRDGTAPSFLSHPQICPFNFKNRETLPS